MGERTRTSAESLKAGSMFPHVPCAKCGATFEVIDVVELPHDGSAARHFDKCPNPPKSPPPIEFHPNPSIGWYNSLPAPELSLLVIDLGDSCLIKVEKGEMPEQFAAMATLGVTLMHSSFKNIQKSIDAGEYLEKPVPRIELSSNVAEGFKTFRLYLSNEDWNDDAVVVLAERELDALSKLVGHDLPIYEPQQGTWAQLYPVDAGGFIPVPSEISQSTPLSALSEWIRQFSIDMPLKVWRYTR